MPQLDNLIFIDQIILSICVSGLVFSFIHLILIPLLLKNILCFFYLTLYISQFKALLKFFNSIVILKQKNIFNATFL